MRCAWVAALFSRPRNTTFSYPDRECPPLLAMRRPNRMQYSSRVEDHQAAAEGFHIDGGAVLNRRAVPPGKQAKG